MEQEQHIKQLYQRYVDGTITGIELGELLDYFHSHGVPPGVDERMMHEIARPVPDAPDAAHQLAERVRLRIVPRRPAHRLVRWLPYAAAIFIAATVAAWIGYGDQVNPGSKVAKLETADIPPGGNRATLTLADGRTISLSEAQAGIVVADGVTYLDGSSVLHGQGNRGTAEPGQAAGGDHGFASAQVHTLTTPKGGTYQVTLADGSRVWLNAGSTLSYPSRFDDGSREVFLEGEAYFEIKEQRINERRPGQVAGAQGLRPFKVLTAGQEIEVLGTEFNVSAYTDAPDTRTTLVEGTVQIVNRTSKTVNRLSPGDQGIVHGAETQVRRVDTAPFTAWKSGLFLFRQTGIHDVMNQLSRWYDIEIRFETAIPAGETFSGKMGRDVQLASVLDFLSGSGINYRLEGRQLVIEGLDYR